jgi:hypothetical protein
MKDDNPQVLKFIQKPNLNPFKGEKSASARVPTKAPCVSNSREVVSEQTAEFELLPERKFSRE